MTNRDEGRVLRRRRRRSSLGGVSDSTVTEGGSVSSLNDEVERMASGPTVSTPLSETDSPVGGRTDAPPDFTPHSRMDEVRSRSRATPYEREYRLKLLHRMLLRNVPLDQIAAELEVSVSTVLRDRKELYRRLREAAKNLDLNEIIGDTLGFYKEVRGMGLRAASASKAPLNMRLAAMRTALGATNDMHRFLSNAGVYDVLRFQPEENTGGGDIEKLIALTEAVLEDKDDVCSTELQSIADLDCEDEDGEIHIL